MAVNMKDLCRLCASKDELCKDILDENNKNVLQLIKDFIQIVIYEDDNLPTKVCLNCEEKMITFQLFVLECYKTQEILRKLCTEVQSCDEVLIKSENTTNGILSRIKYEVKDETATENIESDVNNEASLSDMLVLHNDNSEGGHVDIDDDDDDYLDNIAIASLKNITKKNIKKKVIIEKDSEEFKEILKQPHLKVKDFVKLECSDCEYKAKTWSALRYHFFKIHRSQPILYCLCGFEIRSKTVLYKHVSDHKLDSKRLKRDILGEVENQDESKYDSLNTKDFVDFVCTTCEKKYSSWYSLRAHCQWAHKTQPLVKCVCGITLKSKSAMYKHVQDHKNPNVFACDKCPRITTTLTALNKHKMRHVPKSERKFCCGSCDKIFNAKEALKSHEKSHIPVEERKIYRCDICNMKFTTRSSASCHKRVVHDKIKGYVCDLCGYACGTNGELRQHRAIHSDDKPFVCEKCNKPFKTYSNLKTHMDTHEDTSYECYICRRVLNSRRTLRKHLLVHEDKCRHVCTYCNKAFKRRQTLKVHMYTHTGDKPLTCAWCEERFAYASTLRSHRLRFHPDKMAAQHQNNAYNMYNSHTMQHAYIKDDSASTNAVPTAAKNEVDNL